MSMVSTTLLLLSYNLYVSAARASGQALPKFFGWSSAVIISGSMSGAIEIDDVVIAKEQTSYAPGDVILFNDRNGVVICHRIIAVKEGAFETKGDANNIQDIDPVFLDHIYGKVQWVIPRIGAMKQVLFSPVVIVLIAVLVILIMVPHYRKRVVSQKA
jgi:signal peptidase